MLYDAKRWEPKVEVPKKTKKKAKAKVIARSTYRRRLLKLAKLLEDDAKNPKGLKFDLREVGRSANAFTPFWMQSDSSKYEAKVDCGTTACAMGLAAISGAFQCAGLSFRMDGDWIEITVDGRKLEYDTAGMRVFGLSRNEARFLFDPGHYPDGQTGAKGERFVAKRIRRFVAGKTDQEMNTVYYAKPF